MIRFRTQYPGVSFTLDDGGEFWMNDVVIGRLFPGEVEAIQAAVADSVALAAERRAA